MGVQEITGRFISKRYCTLMRCQRSSLLLLILVGDCCQVPGRLKCVWGGRRVQFCNMALPRWYPLRGQSRQCRPWRERYSHGTHKVITSLCSPYCRRVPFVCLLPPFVRYRGVGTVLGLRHWGVPMARVLWCWILFLHRSLP